MPVAVSYTFPAGVERMNSPSSSPGLVGLFPFPPHLCFSIVALLSKFLLQSRSWTAMLGLRSVKRFSRLQCKAKTKKILPLFFSTNDTLAALCRVSSFFCFAKRARLGFWCPRCPIYRIPFLYLLSSLLFLSICLLSVLSLLPLLVSPLGRLLLRVVPCFLPSRFFSFFSLSPPPELGFFFFIANMLSWHTPLCGVWRKISNYILFPPPAGPVVFFPVSSLPL